MIGLHDELVEYRTHFRWALIIVAIAFSILVARLVQLQVVEGDRYEVLALVSHVVRDRLAPARGTIRDRNGDLLAVDVEISDLMMVPQSIKDPEREVGRLRELGVLDDDGYGDVLDLVKQAKGDRRKLQRLPARRNLVGARCPYDLSPMSFDSVGSRMVCSQCGRSFVDQKAVVQTHLHELPGFSLRSRTVRYYPAKGAAAHVVGFVNEVTPGDIERSEGRLRAGDVVGRSGLERALDDALRGVPGEDVFVRSANGQRIRPGDLPEPFQGLESTPPIRGRDVTLTIDSALQKAAAEALKPFKSGAAVALDADTGEVLALVSEPSFDPGPVLVQGNGPVEKAESWYAPMMNKAVVAFPPGSTFKMITAIAALSEGLIGEDTESQCPGFYEFHGHRFNCFKRSGHGKIRLIRALAESCDTYFYELGDQLGIDNIAHYARDVFGLGERTGIEISDQAGTIPTERWYKRHRFGFQPGFAINTSVGQGDVRVTPLQMARAYAALVNGGRLMRPHVVASVVDARTGQPVPVEPEVQRTLDLNEDFVSSVMAGLYGAVNFEGGTARSAILRELPFAGKTGTAQAREIRKNVPGDVAAWLLQDHAWFVGYGPAQRPRIVVAAFVEHGGFGGAVAAPVVRRVLEAYYAEHADEFADLWQGFEDDDLELVKP